jgi:hypothetical protein
MTMDEVNARFPLTKYKAWVTTRAAEGLSTEGGVASPQSRPGSVKNVDGVLSNPQMTPKPDELLRSPTPSGPAPEVSSDAKPMESSSPISREKPTDAVANGAKPSPPTSPTPPTPQQVHDDVDMDDDDHIQIAVPTEMLANPGDSCAICLDTLEDDDDVRGLTCGHAFHAGCLDPWLTSRRACCPLCKTDYHVPKPRPEGEEATEGERRTGRRPVGSNGGRDDLPQPPQYAFMGGGRGASLRPRMIFPRRFMSVGYSDNRERRPSLPVVARLTRPSTRTSDPGTAASPTRDSNRETETPPGWRSRVAAWRPKMSLPNRLRRNHTTNVTAEADGAPPDGVGPSGPSPGQLEAGVR